MNVQTRNPKSGAGLLHKYCRSLPLFRRLRPRLALSQKGSALVMAVIFSIVAASLMVVAGKLISNSAKAAKRHEVNVTEAENVARAGLVDAINWFIRKGVVKAGYPLSNPPCQYIDDAFINSSNTVASDTLDSTIGIVNQFALESAKNLYARYEVRRQLNPAGTPTAVSYDPHAVHDITAESTLNSTHYDGQGLVWYLESVGYVFQRLDPSKAYNVYPNKVLGSARMSTVIKKMALTMPAPAAAIATTMNTIKSVSRGKIISQAGSYCAAATSNAGGGPVSSGSPAGVFSGSVTYNPLLTDISEGAVFGLSGYSEVKSLADLIGSATSPINFSGSYKLAYYEGDVTYDPAASNVLLQQMPVGTSGVLYVHGNLTIKDGTNSFFDGLIYATGAVTIGIACQVQGAVIAKNGVVVGNTGSLTGDNAYLYYGSGQLTKAQQSVGIYREDRASTRTFQMITNP